MCEISNRSMRSCKELPHRVARKFGADFGRIVQTIELVGIREDRLPSPIS